MAIVFVLSVTFWTGCENRQEGVVDNATPSQQAPVLSKDNPQVRNVMVVQEKYTADIMTNKNVVGTAVGLTEDGQVAMVIFLKTEQTTPLKARGIFSTGLPKQIEGVPVITEVTGEFKAMADHKAIQTPPIQLGTSGGWRYDLANGYCCGGTLGSLISKGGQQYVMSNYHVLEADIVLGGNNRVAQAGDPVIQPGLIDVACNQNNAQNVASLSGFKSLPSTNVDVSYAQTISGMVRTDGAILDVGTIHSGTGVAAFVGQAVKKSGRTTGLSRSSVSQLNATVSITYENECAGGTSFTKTFTGQIVIKNRGSKFLNSGDSGSLMVEDVTTNANAVGLLYAGSSTSAIANPIGEVLSVISATMVGN